MMNSLYGQILKTKLVPPRITDHILFRSALSRRFKEIGKNAVTLIHSGPGSGKSTALASFLRSEKYTYCWYSVTEHDNHLFRFFHYIVESVRAEFPAFARELESEFFQKLQMAGEQDIYAACGKFINKLFALEEEILLVIDDFHLVENSRDIETFIKWFILHMPEHIHLVLSGRSRPGWEQLTALKMKGKVCELSEKDLSFSKEEIEVLFEDHYGYRLPDNAAGRIYERTEGWIIAIQMIWQQLNEGLELSEILDKNTGSMVDLFSFMAMEVMEKQPENVQSFLKQSSILDTITAETCAGIFKRHDAGEMINYLIHKNLFLIPEGGSQYRYHSLFKDFLYEQLKDQGKLADSLHKRAGDYFADCRQTEEAVHHYRKNNDNYSIARLLHEQGDLMMKRASLESLFHILNSIPETIKDTYHKLWIFEGDIYRYRSKYELALICYKRAQDKAEAAGDLEGESLGLEGIAKIYLDTIQPKQAEQWLRKVIDLEEQEYNGDSGRLIHLYTLMAENSINSGRAKEAEHWYGKSRKIHLDFYEEELEARIHLRTGRFASALKILEKPLFLDGSGKMERLPRSHRERELLLSLVYAFLGDGQKAKESAERGIMQGVENKSPYVEACGWIRMGHAVQLTNEGDTKLAEQCYKTALSIMEEINMSRGKAEPLMGLSFLYGRRKNLKLALQYSEAALQETEKVDDLWLSSLIRVSRGISFLTSEKYPEAGEEFAMCRSGFQRCGDSHGLAVTLLWESFLAHQRQDWQTFFTSISHMLKLVENEGYDHLFQERCLLGPGDVQKLSPMLLDAQQQILDDSYLDRLLINMGIEDVENHPGYTLRINTLGGFSVYLGDELVSEKSWKREKSKELLQLFITKRKYLLPKEEVFLILWEDQDGKVAERDFKVALNALNKVLEPKRKARSQPFFIQRHASSYGINLAAPFELDTITFESGVMKGLGEKDSEKAAAFLRNGLQAYKGDYLPERSSDDWCIEERERLQVLFLRGAERLAELCIESSQFYEAIDLCEQIIAKDKCWEEAYRLLMKCYMMKNNRSMAIKWFERCRKTLLEELGVQPMRKTLEDYEQLLEGV
ncbi:BTAD domain-containing putative transcriptional regulator [Evansella clarkii]|uniref:BTAD domain-containing putative transcriptional regulator n=1 Tax=Evansella clarkii TaxID=79879 RepID=UPI000B437E13|nr:BTAD domain-containing putative transcriptional regulator [Evansella clarkii]